MEPHTLPEWSWGWTSKSLRYKDWKDRKKDTNSVSKRAMWLKMARLSLMEWNRPSTSQVDSMQAGPRNVPPLISRTYKHVSSSVQRDLEDDIMLTMMRKESQHQMGRGALKCRATESTQLPHQAGLEQMNSVTVPAEWMRSAQSSQAVFLRKQEGSRHHGGL